MKLTDLLRDDWIVAPIEATTVVDALIPVLRRVRPEADDRDEWAHDLAQAVLSEGRGEVARVVDDFVVAIGSLDTLDGAALGIGVASSRFDAMAKDADDPGQARAVLLVLSPKRPAGVRQQLVPAIARALRDPGSSNSLIAACIRQDLEAVRRVLDVEFRPRLFVEDAVVPVQYRVYPETPFSEVVDLMVRRGVHAVPVVGEGYEVLGIVTSGDALGQLLQVGRPGQGEQGSRSTVGETKARGVMQRSVLCVSEDQALVDAANMMVNRDVEQLPVVRDGELVGFVTRKSILRALHGTLDPDNHGSAECESET